MLRLLLWRERKMMMPPAVNERPKARRFGNSGVAAFAFRVARRQSAGTPLRVCKSVCIEEKITEREVADYVASEE